MRTNRTVKKIGLVYSRVIPPQPAHLYGFHLSVGEKKLLVVVLIVDDDGGICSGAATL